MTMASRGTVLWSLCIFYSAVSTVFSASMQASFTPNPALKGDSKQHTVRCDFSVEGDEMIQTVQLHSKPSDKVIATLSSQVTKPVWSTGSLVDSLKARGDVYGSLSLKYLSLVLNDRCSDQGASYICRMVYFIDNIGPVKENETSVEIQAVPLTPNPMSVTPALNTENVTEYSEMTFRCSGNVGKPAGSFSWFTVNGGTGDRQNVTGQAPQESAVPSGDGCTFTQSSTLILNLTRTEEGEPLKVFCLVNHPTLDDPGQRECSDPDSGLCRSSSPINVQYPVSVSVDVQPVVILEGTDTSINCVPQGNPKPHLIEWRREGENETLSTEATLTLKNLTLNDTGSFVCTAYNTISGVTRHASDTVLVTVVKTTAPSPTTTPPSTTEGEVTKDPGSDTSKAGLGDKDIIIIVVVLAAVVLVVAIVVIVIIIRRRRSLKQFEETPEKSVNNQLEVNSMAMQPDPSVTGNQPPENNAGVRNEDGLTYADLEFDNQPRSRRPLALNDSHTDYADISMPHV